MAPGLFGILAVLSGACSIAWHLANERPGGLFEGYYAEMSRAAAGVCVFALVFLLVALTARWR